MHSKSPVATSNINSELPLISAVDVGKCYRIYDKPHHRLLQAVFRSRVFYRDFWALRDLSLEVRRGECIGILGQNGSGKSTLLQIISGTIPPSVGEVRVRGRVAALLELGSGFNPEFTGRENVYIYGSILGLSRPVIQSRFDEIVAFSEIEKFIDQPVKTYSSGMMMRLAFSVAINVDPEILIVDEALSVGDARFQQRCMTRIRQLCERGVAMLFVTHDTEACKRLCQRVYILEKGRVLNHGPADIIANSYLAHLSSLDDDHVRVTTIKETNTETSKKPNSADRDFSYLRHGDGNGNIESCELLNMDGKRVEQVTMDSRYRLRFQLSFKIAHPAPIFGFFVRDRLATDILGINTLQERTPLPEVTKGSSFTVDVEFQISLKPGYYSVSPALAYDQYTLKYMDWINNALVFRVVDDDPRRIVFGLVHVPVTVKIHSKHPSAKIATQS